MTSESSSSMTNLELPARPTMEQLIAHLSHMQIDKFFSRCAPVTQSQCNEMAAALVSGSVTPSTVQGAHSYTVVGEQHAVQFRLEDSPLDIELLQNVEQAYAGFVPRHAAAGKMDDLYVYTMNDVGGISMYLARTRLHAQDCLLLQKTLQDYARFFSMPWFNTPPGMTRPSRDSLYNQYSTQLTQLAEGLPERFRPTLDYILSNLQSLFTDDWPMVPNHVDLLENNIHVDLDSGSITGICDWQHVDISPFGMSLGWLETMLGYRSLGEGWTYLSNQKVLRNLFWNRFFSDMGELSQEQVKRIEVARLAGLFLENGFKYDKDDNKLPAPEGYSELRYLEAVVREQGWR